MLLSGDVMFVEQDLPNFEEHRLAYIMSLASECDLSAIDDLKSPYWSAVNRRAKSFVKTLLVLDETIRFSAHRALQHPWLSHPDCAAQIDALYHRAISKWQPPSQKVDLVQNIDTSHFGASPLSLVAKVVYTRIQDTEDVQSPYFNKGAEEPLEDETESVMCEL